MSEVRSCTKCGERKPLAEFYVRQSTGAVNPWCRACYREWHRNRYAPQGDETDSPRPCAVCGVNFTPKQRRAAMYCSAECKNRSPKHREKHLRRKYGITSADYDAMLAAQGGRCALCDATPETQRAKYKTFFHVDHCHDTGRVRGLLCGEHNLMLGRWGDDPAQLRRAADYLEAKTIG